MKLLFTVLLTFFLVFLGRSQDASNHSIDDSGLVQVKTWRESDSLQRVFSKEKEYDVAKAYALKAVTFYRKSNNKNDKIEIYLLSQLAGINFFLKEYDLQVSVLEKVMSILNKEKLKNDYYYRMLSWLGTAYYYNKLISFTTLFSFSNFFLT